MSPQDPELGSSQVDDTGMDTAAAPSPATPRNAAAAAHKKPILIAAGAVCVATILGVAIGVPVARRKAAAAAAADAEAEAAGSTGSNGEGGDSNPASFAFASEAFLFTERLKPFNQNVMDGYGSCSDLLSDITSALQVMANEEILRGMDQECFWGNYYPGGGGGGVYYEQFDSTSNKEGSAPTAMATTAASGASTEDSYGTNNQVDGVDEADIVKSNGRQIFMGYGDEIIVTSIEGDILLRQKVPLPPNVTEEVEDVPDPELGSSPARSSIWYYYQPPKVRSVTALLMQDDVSTGKTTLSAITTYNQWRCDSPLCGGLTTVFQYEFDEASPASLTLQGSTDINGSYNNARSIGSVNHITTNANINSWEFTGPLYRCDRAYRDMNSTQYQEAAYVKANETVAKFAEDMLGGLSWLNGQQSDSCKHIVKISTMTNEVSTDDVSVKAQRRLSLFNGQGLLQNFVQVTSLDVSTAVAQGAVAADGTVALFANAAGAFVPSYSPELYASTDSLVIAGRGWRYNEDRSWNEFTFLMTFDLQQNVAVPKAVGEVPGYLKDQFSMDVHQKHLRVATTSLRQWGFNNDTQSWDIMTNSTSQVLILKESDSGSELVETGSITGLGVTEEIKSVRFMGDNAFVVTFRQVDPLYALDLSDPTNPTVQDELKITGFSEYMHPIKNGQYLLTVGKEADENDGGRVTGTKISLFDIRDITDVKNVTDHVIGNEGGWTNSDAGMDHYAFRYLEESEKLILPLEVYNWENQTSNFDGFIVYDVNVGTGGGAASISEVGKVAHASGEKFFYDFCWGAAKLPSRSMVFGGNLMTFKSHGIIMTADVNSLLQADGSDEPLFTINLDENRTSDSCNNYGPWWPRPFV